MSRTKQLECKRGHVLGDKYRARVMRGKLYWVRDCDRCRTEQAIDRALGVTRDRAEE